MSSMRAALFRRHGGPEVLEIGEVPTPTPGPGEVQVRVSAAGLNHIDLWLRRGLPALKIALPHISGGDVCGSVSALGAGVRGVAEGRRVVVNPGISCGRCRACLDGRDNLCPDYQLLGEHNWGGQAEYVVVPAANIVPVPTAASGISDAALASVPIAFITAWQMLVDRAMIKQGETVLVLAGGSGVGSAAIQIAKLYGARVIATASTAEKRAAAKALGADEAIDGAGGGGDGFLAEVKRLTDRRGADIVVEHVGAATFPQSVLACARGGRIVTCGATAGFEPVLNLRHVFWRQLSILGSTLASKARLFDVMDLMAAGRLRPVVDRVLPLVDVATGHALLESRAAFGKIVLTL
jgi:NADPH:quinone reductase-like Zn-dependent oxidoreductase